MPLAPDGNEYSSLKKHAKRPDTDNVFQQKTTHKRYKHAWEFQLSGRKGTFGANIFDS